MSAAHVFDDPGAVAIARSMGATTWIARTSRGSRARGWDELGEADREEIRIQTKREVTDTILAVAYWERLP